jgi:hypothetical protein
VQTPHRSGTHHGPLEQTRSSDGVVKGDRPAPSGRKVSSGQLTQFGPSHLIRCCASPEVVRGLQMVSNYFLELAQSLSSALQ